MILGIETSTSHASLAVFDPTKGDVVWKSDFVSERAHNAVIFEPVEEMLAQYREQLTGIIVGLGPGSYGGVRVGISVANGLSMVLGLPVKGRSSLTAWAVDGDRYSVLGDARRKTIFLAAVCDGELEGEPELIGEDAIGDRISGLEGSGSCLVTPDARVADRWDSIRLSYPAAERLFSGKGVGVPEEWPGSVVLEPHYLRAPYITTPKKK